MWSECAFSTTWSTRPSTSERQAPAPVADDLLAMLVDARDEPSEAMTRCELQDQIITVLFGGYEATARSIAWT
jgi:cytochrome P450